MINPDSLEANPIYYIGTLKDEFLNYSLVMRREIGDLILLQKQIRLEDEVAFDEEVNNLVKYFNASVLIEDLIDRTKYPKKSVIEKEVKLREMPIKTTSVQNIILNFPHHTGKTITPEHEAGIETAIKLWALNEKSIEIK